LLRYVSDNGRAMRLHAQLIGGLNVDLSKTVPASDRDPLTGPTSTPHQTTTMKFFRAEKGLAEKPKVYQYCTKTEPFVKHQVIRSNGPTMESLAPFQL
jgi:hypothetical protein